MLQFCFQSRGVVSVEWFWLQAERRRRTGDEDLGDFWADQGGHPQGRLTSLLPGPPLSVWPWEAWLPPSRSSSLSHLGVVWMEPTTVLLSPSQTLLSPHTHSEIKLLHSPVCFSISKIWSKYSFPFTRGADSTCSIEVVEGVPLHKSNKADFAVIKFYKVTLTLSWSGLLQTALLINHSRVLTFPDINNTAAPWPEQKGGNGRGFTLSFPLGYLQTSFSSCVWENVKPVFLFICTKTFFILSWTCALCHLALPHGWGDLTLGSDEGHALTRGILTDLTDGGYEGV